MVRVSYPGVGDAKQAFEALRPLYAAVIAMQMRCRPFGPDYLILNAVAAALNTAAYHFTREADFFAAKAPRS